MRTLFHLRSSLTLHQATRMLSKGKAKAVPGGFDWDGAMSEGKEANISHSSKATPKAINEEDDSEKARAAVRSILSFKASF